MRTRACLCVFFLRRTRYIFASAPLRVRGPQPVVTMFARRSLFLVCVPVAVAFRESWADSLLRGAKLSDSELNGLADQAQRLPRETLAASAPPGPVSCGMCEAKTYFDTCPQGWVESADGLCEAPPSYGGFCSHQLSFVGSSVSSKIAAETSCDVCWSCGS